jgi:hypothetical protein
LACSAACLAFVRALTLLKRIGMTWLPEDLALSREADACLACAAALFAAAEASPRPVTVTWYSISVRSAITSPP